QPARVSARELHLARPAAAAGLQPAPSAARARPAALHRWHAGGRAGLLLFERGSDPAPRGRLRVRLHGVGPEPGFTRLLDHDRARAPGRGAAVADGRARGAAALLLSGSAPLSGYLVICMGPS